MAAPVPSTPPCALCHTPQPCPGRGTLQSPTGHTAAPGWGRIVQLALGGGSSPEPNPPPAGASQALEEAEEAPVPAVAVRGQVPHRRPAARGRFDVTSGQRAPGGAPLPPPALAPPSRAALTEFGKGKGSCTPRPVPEGFEGDGCPGGHEWGTHRSVPMCQWEGVRVHTRGVEQFRTALPGTAWQSIACTG